MGMPKEYSGTLKLGEVSGGGVFDHHLTAV